MQSTLLPPPDLNPMGGRPGLPDIAVEARAAVTVAETVGCQLGGLRLAEGV